VHYNVQSCTWFKSGIAARAGEFDEFGDINGAMRFAYCALRTVGPEAPPPKLAIACTALRPQNWIVFG
jgi:hypothetical protein